MTTANTTSIPPMMTVTDIYPTTTELPSHTNSTVIGVVIVLVLLTLAALAFFLYRYLCHNKGDYRTTGEPAPGEDKDPDHSHPSADEKKEYFI